VIHLATLAKSAQHNWRMLTFPGNLKFSTTQMLIKPKCMVITYSELLR